MTCAPIRFLSQEMTPVCVTDMDDIVHNAVAVISFLRAYADAR